ncbi:MAG: hypothetical protein KC609_00960, partial [Myxococcales bacterium]|nr:hypothetical protein [Myxococcales bacterium]
NQEGTRDMAAPLNLQKLKRASDQLKRREIRDIVKLVAQVGQRWRNPSDPIRAIALESLPREFGLSPQGLDWGLELIFGDWTEDQIWDLLIDQVGNPHLLDRFADRDELTRAHVRGPRVMLQILAGTSPASMAHAVLIGILAKAGQILKAPSGQPTFLNLLRRTIQELDAELAEAIAVGTWSERRRDLYQLMDEADTVVAYGTDTTIGELRPHCGPKTQFVGFGHAVSVAIVARQFASQSAAEQLAWDAMTYDQRGCLSPRAVFVEEGGSLSPRDFAELLADRVMPEVAAKLPGGAPLPGEAEAVAQRRGVYGFKGLLFSGSDWTVTYDEHKIWPDEALPRFLTVKPFSTMDELVSMLKPAANHLLCVGLGAPEERWDEFCTMLAPSSVSRICPLGVMQCPPLNWENDGRSPFRSIVRWCRVETPLAPAVVV